MEINRANVRTGALRKIFIVLVSIAAGFGGGWFGSAARQNGSIMSSTRQEIILNESELISSLVDQIGPSVVSVNVISEGVASDLFGFQRNVQRSSAGTGFVISKDGLVLTNRHVVPKGASNVSLTLSDGTELTDVEIIGRTSDSDPLDVAFLRIKDGKGKDLTPLKIGDSSKVRVGDKVVAIGNALGQFQNTVTSGIISGYGRSIQAGDASQSETLQNLFQTDAAINQGNSGGPLVNINGEVIGINTAVAGGAAENIGFSIPINDVQGLIKSVIDTGKVLRPYLGVRYIILNDDFAYEYNLPVKRGAYLAPQSQNGNPVLKGSPAEKAGLREKDIIVRANGQNIDETNSLVSILGRFSVDEEVTLTIIRDGKEQDVRIKLEAAPES